MSDAMGTFPSAAGIVALLMIGINSQLLAQPDRWSLDKIEASAQGFGSPRQTKVLPLDMREKKDIWWQHTDRETGGIRKLSMEIVFSDLKTEMKPNDTFISLDSKVTAVVEGPGPEFATMQCSSAAKTTSGFEKGDIGSGALNAISHRVPNGQPTSMDCAPRIVNTLPKEDFILTVRIAWFDGSPRMSRAGDNGDITFQFFYKWNRSGVAGNRGSPSPCFSDKGAVSIDRNDHYTWAQQQGAATLLRGLKAKAGIVFQCPPMTVEKLANIFADVSVIIANRAPRAACFGGDAGAASPDWNGHKNWGAGQGRDVMLGNLQGKIAAVLGCMSRGQQNAFFAEVSVAFAKGAP